MTHSIRRCTTAALISVGLCLALSIAPGPVHAMTPAATRPSISQFCEHLASAIAFLTAQKPSPLRDFLIAQLRRVETRYCG